MNPTIWKPIQSKTPARKPTSTFTRFEVPGQALEGRWLGWGEGPFGAIGRIETASGVKTFSPSTVLRNRLDGIDEGSLIRIVYEGKRTSKSGRDYKAFEILIAEGEEE